MSLRGLMLLGAFGVGVLVSQLCFAARPANQDNESNDVITISADQAKQLFDAGVTFIDVRSKDEWHLGHIKNALHIEFNQDFEQLRRWDQARKDKPIVIYCSSSECQSGALASAVSLYWGFNKVFYFADGYFSWLLQDYPAVMNTTNAAFTQLRH